MHKTGHGRSRKKERSLCTHCGLHGHTIDKCYKLHIHPNQMNPTVNQVCETHQNLPNSNQVMGDFMQTLSPTQYQQHLLNMLNTHLNVAKTQAKLDASQDQA